MNTIRETITTSLHDLTARRAARQAHRRLVAEVSQMYATPTGRAEIDAIMRRHSDDQIAEIDAIVGRQLASR